MKVVKYREKDYYSNENERHIGKMCQDVIALFGAINISGTGRIDKDEFADLFYHLDLDISEEYLIKLFNAADRDGSGAIEIGDFLTTFHESKKEQGVYETRLKETFEMMDLDNDGYLSREEIKECILATCRDTPEAMIFSLIEDADTNEDGHISYTEFLEMWRTYGKNVTKDRADSLYEIITSQATDGRIKQKAQSKYVNEETMTTQLHGTSRIKRKP
ncbi:calmodulin-like protein 5 isoform X2 [Rhopilema esculentum]|uniref:calmodulin-like protein 5 isoform X2 n=1 Tax=Rhopilema esculentum TaxID=499914 RepID=UPI0031D4588F